MELDTTHTWGCRQFYMFLPPNGEPITQLINFQSESKKSGDEFEGTVYQDLVSRGFTKITKNYYVPMTGCEVDFLAMMPDGYFEYVEAKGGNVGDKKRPGAKRTDNVKKSIANGSLIKARYSNIKYVVYFSATPEPESYSAEMIQTALTFNIIDEVRYLEPYKQLNFDEYWAEWDAHI